MEALHDPPLDLLAGIRGFAVSSGPDNPLFPKRLSLACSRAATTGFAACDFAEAMEADLLVLPGHRPGTRMPTITDWALQVSGSQKVQRTQMNCHARVKKLKRRDVDRENERRSASKGRLPMTSIAGVSVLTEYLGTPRCCRRTSRDGLRCIARPFVQADL